jgi:hypothetical protein
MGRGAGMDEAVFVSGFYQTLEDAFVPSGEFEGKVPQLCAH